MLFKTLGKIDKVVSRSRKKFFKKKEIDDLAIEIRDILLEADIPYQYIIGLIKDMKKKLSSITSKKLNKKFVIGNFLKIYISNTFSHVISNGIFLKNNDITTIGIYGSCGVGKTVFAAKLANFFQKKYKKKVLCVSFDFKKHLSCDKLKILCKNNYIDFINMKDFGLEKGIQKVREIIKYKVVDVLIIDNSSIIDRDCNNNAVWKVVMSNVKFDEKIVVLDGMCGQCATSLIDCYNNNVCPTGFAISKVDNDAECSVFFSVANMSSKQPIYYISNGEKISNIKEFNKETFNTMLFEKDCVKNVTNLIKTASHNDTKRNILPFIGKVGNRGVGLFKLDYNEFLKQLILLRKSKKHCKLTLFFLKIAKIPETELSTDIHLFIEKWISIIMSMTKFERLNVGCLCNGRIKRIANGSGVTIDDVAMLQKKIEEINEELIN